MSLKKRVEQVLKAGADSNSDLTTRYAVHDVEHGMVRVGPRQQVNVAEYLGSDTLVGHPYDNSELKDCEIRLVEDGFLIEWMQDPAGDYLLVREATAG